MKLKGRGTVACLDEIVEMVKKSDIVWPWGKIGDPVAVPYLIKALKDEARDYEATYN